MALPLNVRLDLSKPVDESALSLKDNLFSSFRLWMSGTKGSKRRAEARAEDYQRALQEEREGFRSYINILINQQLSRNSLLLENNINGETAKVEIHLSRISSDILDTCMKAGDFDEYDIREIDVDPDILRAEPNIPIYLEIRNRIVNE